MAGKRRRPARPARHSSGAVRKRLQGTEEHFRLLAQNVKDYAIFMLDPAGYVASWNEAATRIKGYEEGEIIGRHFSCFYPSEEIETGEPGRDLQVAVDAGSFEDVGWRIRKDGSRFWANVIITALRDVTGRLRGFAKITRDITDRKHIEERLQRQLARLAALRTIDMAIMASLDVRVTLNVLLDQVTSHLRVDAADVLLLSPHTQTLDFGAERGFSTRALQHAHLRLGEGYAGRAALERRLLSVRNLTETPGEFGRASLLTDEGFITYFAAPLVAKGQVKGVLEIFHRSLLSPDQEWFDFLDALSGQAAIAIDNATLVDDLQRANTDLTLAYDTALVGWSRALELRDKETEGHTRRVTELTLRLARTLGVTEADLVHLRRGALLHDIGKMGIPDSILHKPGPLTEEEWEIMRRHPGVAFEFLFPIYYLRPALDIPYCHHEKWDGTGYPRGLKGEEIPLAARIFAVADVWDAVRSDRPYRPAWTEEEARTYIREQAGKHFDARVVEVFFQMEKELVTQGTTPVSPSPVG